MIVHTVRQGETLSAIAARYGTTYQAIAQFNGLSNPNLIYVGQQLRIPDAAGGGGQPAPVSQRFIQPVAGVISSRFGASRGDHEHAGIDIAAPCGTPIKAAAAGRVSVARWSDSAGNMVILDHGGGIDTRYFHLSQFAVGAGASVAQGQVIGYVGSTGNSTGCHLHWEVRINGQPTDPMRALQGGLTVAPGQAGQVSQAGQYQSAGFSGQSMALAFGIFALVVFIARR